MDDSATTRERIATYLRAQPATPSDLAAEFAIATGTALSHVEHISRSLDASEESVLVAPPECRDCGFTDFDDLLNCPSRCPACRNEGVAEPAFTVE